MRQRTGHHTKDNRALQDISTKRENAKALQEISSHKEHVRILHQLVQHSLLQKEELQSAIKALEDDIHLLADSLEVIPDNNKKAQIMRDYNSMIAAHQAKTKQQAAAVSAYVQAEQAFFTASIELSKLQALEKQLLDEEFATINEQKELEIEKIRKVEKEMNTRHQEQVERDRINEENTLRAMEESRRARVLAQERLRIRLEDSKTQAEHEQKIREEDAQKRMRSLLSLKQNYDSALAELKASNERRSKIEKAQNDAKLQETATLLSQEITHKKQKELNRIAAMAAQRREDVQKLVAEDVRQYNTQQKRAHQNLMRRTRARPVTTNSTENENEDEGENENENGCDSHAEVVSVRGSIDEMRTKERFVLLGATSERDIGNLGVQDKPDRIPSPSKKVFSLNLPNLRMDKKGGTELYGLQSALSFASLASSALPSNRSSTLDIGGDFETLRALSVSQRMDGDRLNRGGEVGKEFKSSRKTRPQKPLSILEQKMMERTMQSLKNNIVKKQVVMNKEFEGKSFITKPNILLFDDFQLGGSYTKKLTITNVSLSFNTFKLLELPARISDFFKVAYAPPGRLSAGTGVTIDVTFTPVLPTPISEKLIILAETGQFEIPIECLPKQCKVSLSTTHIEFDNISLGETQVRTVKLFNNGGLESPLELSFDSLSCSIDGNSNTYTDPDGTNVLVADIVQAGFVIRTIPIIKPYSTQSLDITFTPTTLGSYSALILFRYKGTDNNPTVTSLLLTGMVSDVPIYLSTREIDFHACYCGQLYRETLVLHNRGKIALKATVKVPALLKKFVECVPRVAFVQAHSSLSIQLKFKPTIELMDQSLAELMRSFTPTPTPTLNIGCSDNPRGDNEASDGMELDKVQPITTNLLPNKTSCVPSCAVSMAVTVEVVSQSSPMWFQLKALVTNPTLSVLPSSFEFGGCSINESISIPFTVSNQSITPVRYGFVHLPKEIQIFPGDGFGALLPLEEMKMEAIFSPITATQHDFVVTLKTDQGRVTTIACSGTGVKPALQFCPAIIAIPPTSIGDINTTSVFLENISKIPQIFEIFVPEEYPFLRVTPVVQTVNPGARAHIKIDFEPGVKLSEATPSEALVGDVTENAKHNGEQTNESLKPRTYSRKSSNRALSSGNGPPTTDSASSPHDVQPSQRGHKSAVSERKSRKKKLGSVANLAETSVSSPLSKTDGGINAEATPLSEVTQVPPLPEGKTLTWRIPCFSKPTKFASTLKEPQPSGDGNTGTVVYLEISAIVAPPTLVRVLEPIDRSIANPPVDFGQVPIGQSVIKKIIIKNNSQNEIKLAAVYGNMTVLNAVRPMLPKQSQVLQIQYRPDSHGMHLESIELTVGKHHRLVVPVQGRGVSPKLTIEPQHEANQIDLGYTIVKDSSKKEIKLVNDSQFAVGYQIHLLRTGPKNLSGINPFSVTPSEGDVPVGGEKVITIVFEPDHENLSFHDELQIEVKSENSKRTIYLKGCCTGTRGMYLDPLGELLGPPLPSSELLRGTTMALSDIIKPGYNGCIPRGSLTMHFTPSSAIIGPIVKSLVFGNAKIRREKGIIGEVTFEPLSPQGVKDGFSMADVGPRFTIEPECTRTIEFRFDPDVHCPRPTHKKSKEPNVPFNGVGSMLQGTVETSIKCTVKEGYSAQDKEGVSFTITLVGYYGVQIG